MSAQFNVSVWLQSEDFAQYVPLFEAQQVDYATLIALTDNDLRDIGIAALGHRKRMLAAIHTLRMSGPVDLPVAAAAPVAPPPAPEPEPVAEAAAENGEIHFEEPEPVVSRVVAPELPPAPPALTGAQAWSMSSPETAELTESRSWPEVDPSVIPQVRTSPVRPKVGLWKKITSNKVLYFSVIAHVVFALGATLWVVQQYAGKRQTVFKSGPPNANPSKRALEHQVSMAKKKAGGAPPQAKRIVTAGLAKISVPDLPTVTTANTIMPNMAAGMGGAGFGTGVGFGNGMGSGMGGGGGNGSGINFFGMRMAAKSVVVVLDISGSMVQGKKSEKTYEILEKEVTKLVNSLAGNTKFGLVCFAKEAHSYKTELVSAGSNEKTSAVSWFKHMSPADALKEMGGKANWGGFKEGMHAGTRADLGMEAAFAMKPDIIFFVSDGQPTKVSPAQVIAQVEQAQAAQPKRTIVNAIAYMADDGQIFMKDLATKNGGSFKEIEPKDVK